MPTRLLAAAVLLATLAGCPAHTSRADKLKEIATAFNLNVRWGRFGEAALVLPAPRRQAWVSAMERASRAFRIVDYEVRPVQITEERALIEVDLTYYRYPDQVIQTQRRRQTWVWRNAWTLQSDHEVEIDEEELPTRLPELIGPEPGETNLGQ